MINKAIEQITEEANAINNAFAIFCEEHLTDLCTTDIIAEKLMNSKKSLKEFCKKCEDEAKAGVKNKTGVQINGKPDAEYYREIEEYYELNDITHDTAPISSEEPIDIMDLL